MPLFASLKAGGWPAHRHLLSLAIPMILANITTPLVGLVDTAVLGRMESPAILAGASIATLIITQLVWVCGFLRMSTTGRSAQAFGASKQNQRTQVFWQSLLLSQLLAGVLILLQSPLFDIGMLLAALDGDAKQAAQDYYFVRVWGFPLAFANLVLIGWLVGQQLTKRVLLIQVIGNCTNALLNVLLVYGFGIGVKGVAAATVVAELVMVVLALRTCFLHISPSLPQRSWFSRSALISLFAMNGNIFLRNLTLQCCIAFITLQGARYGVIAAGVNAIVMQFFALIALGLDGIAYAVEALVGKAKGERNRRELLQHVVQGCAWSSLFAVAYGLIFGFFHLPISSLLTDHSGIISALQPYVTVLVLLPLVGHWCFLFDGVAVGLTQAKAMRDTMLLSALLGFAPVWWWFHAQGNAALWYGMLAFLAARGISLGAVFYRDYVIRDGLQ